MKTILLLRHAKSDWDVSFGHDHERPLASRGEKAAQAVGVFLSRTDQVPDSVICSSAVRAKQTLALAQKAGSWNTSVRTTDKLYGATPNELLAQVRREPDTTESLMLVGHEPTWSDTLSQLVGGGLFRFPTAALARIDFDIRHWKETDFGFGILIWLLPPKLLP